MSFACQNPEHGLQRRSERSGEAQRALFSCALTLHVSFVNGHTDLHADWRFHLGRSFDLTMLTLQNSKERDAGEWEVLFQEADPRFKFIGIRKLLGPSSLIEAEWQDDRGEMVEN